jgi:hypothetical protein
MRDLILLSIGIALLGGLFSDNPELGPSEAGQSVADVLQSYTSADGAFVPADLISKPLLRNDLATLLSYPKESFVVLTLTGAQIQKAFERSVLLYPDPNAGFLQVAGFEISFRKGALPNSRVTEVKLKGSIVEAAEKYEIAMPDSLREGQLGYSDIWEKAKVFHDYAKVTMQELLAGKHSASSGFRWHVQP